MSEFDSLNWAKCKLDSNLARSIRTDCRIHRRERGRGGHRYRYATLKNLWAVDIIHAVLNHTDDPVWQYWYNHPRQGWLLVSWHLTRREAQAAAELPIPIELIEPLPPTAPEFGWHVHAGWPNKPFTMHCPCSSFEISCEIEAVFTDIGCKTEKEFISAPLPVSLA